MQDFVQNSPFIVKSWSVLLLHEARVQTRVEANVDKIFWDGSIGLYCILCYFQNFVS